LRLIGLQSFVCRLDPRAIELPMAHGPIRFRIQALLARTDRPPTLANRVHSLVPSLLFGVSSPALPATPFRATRPAGVPSLFAALLQGVHSVRELSDSRYVPSSGFLNLSTVCSTLRRCRLITSRSHVQGSPFRGFSRPTAALIRHQRVPPCRFRPRTHRLASCHAWTVRLRGLDP
jgi:hypothetical protein